LSFVYPVPGLNGEDRVYLIRRGCVRAESAAPRTTSDRQQLRALVAQTFGAAEHTRGTVPAHEVDELMLVSGWFRLHPAELARARAAGTSVPCC
jgi:excinuclease ABC subunit C